MKSLFLSSLIALSLCSCMSETAKQTIEEYNRMFEKVTTLEKLVQTSDFSTLSGEEIVTLYNTGNELYYDYNPMDLKEEQKAACEALKERVAKLRVEIPAKAKAEIPNFKITPWPAGDKLFEKTETFPVFLKRGEKLRWSFSAQKPMNVKVIDYNSRATLKTYTGKAMVNDSLAIEHDAIYLVEVNPLGTQYVDMDINYKVTEMARLTASTPIKVEQVECNKGDFGAVAVQGVSMRKAFEQPRKFTLRGQLKAAFSGSAIALVAVQVPAGATDILYSMRIDTSESGRSSDGKFHDNLNTSYKKVKFLGLPLYEKTNSSGLLNTLLDDNRPLRDEDAYCNMYVFRSQSLAKQFQDGTKPASQLSYDVDYSTLGTQSCNGRIPANGSKTIYLGFENERVRYTNYLWVEAEVVVPTMVYYTTKYSVE
ncbi:MAG: hypothetical protein IKY64_09125 [Bacteroidaceae bacterium]|nr:hypothetical protein [Bacteroidaceae bacterium]